MPTKPNSLRLAALALAFAVLPCAAFAQFTDTFATIDPAWTPNRYAPAGFESVVFDGDNRLQLTIDQTGATANRDITFSSPFYSIQGEQRPGGVTGRWTLSADVYVAAAFDTTTGPIVRTALWGHSGTTPAGGAYLILGFSNASPTDEYNSAAADRAFRFRAFDFNFGDYVDLGVPSGFVFDAWHKLSGTSTGTAFEYRIDGALLHTVATPNSLDLLSAMIQGYNFDQDGGYSVYWDNVSTTAIPEPAAFASFAALAALGCSVARRRRGQRGELVSSR